MASLLARKKLVSSNLIPQSLCAAHQAIPASRLFNTKAGGEFDDGEVEDDDGYDSGIRRSLPRYTRYLVSPEPEHDGRDHGLSVCSRGILPRRWEATETEKWFYVPMNVPEWRKEDVWIWGEHNYMFIEERSNDSMGNRFTPRIKIDLPLQFYKSERIKAEMKNGVLKIVVLRGLWERERAEDFCVKVV